MNKLKDTFFKDYKFTLGDQELFANLSEDFNPIHLDYIHSRRTQYGEPIVHGIHLMIKALDMYQICLKKEKDISSLRVRFNKPVFLNESVSFCLKEDNFKKTSISAQVNNMEVMNIHINQELKFNLDDLNYEDLNQEKLDKKPNNLNMESIIKKKGNISISASGKDILNSFPGASKLLSYSAIKDLLTLSKLVGMACPGLHSIFGGFKVEICSSSRSSSLFYKVKRADSRFGLVDIDVISESIRGTVECIYRTPPVNQEKIDKIKELIPLSSCFSNQYALIIGGSRGIGESIAKILCAGGANTIITYSTGLSDAERVSNEILRAGGNCQVAQYKVGEITLAQSKILLSKITHVYYMATPTIFKRSTIKPIDKERVALFLNFFCLEFASMCSELDLLGRKINVFYPSSEFVSSKPSNMFEYAFAKATGETLCEQLNNRLKNIVVKYYRLPVLLTDQTAGLKNINHKDSLQIIFSLVSKFNRHTI